MDEKKGFNVDTMEINIMLMNWIFLWKKLLYTFCMICNFTIAITTIYFTISELQSNNLNRLNELLGQFPQDEFCQNLFGTWAIFLTLVGYIKICKNPKNISIKKKSETDVPITDQGSIIRHFYCLSYVWMI